MARVDERVEVDHCVDMADTALPLPRVRAVRVVDAARGEDVRIIATE